MDLYKSVIYSVIISACFVSIHSTQAVKEWATHSAIVTKFKCEIPQPRSVNIKDIVGEDLILKAQNIIPTSTVLHRCGSSGCCGITKTCVPQHTEEVKLVFRIKYFDHKRHKFMEFRAQNHTKCGCEDPSNSPK